MIFNIAAEVGSFITPLILAVSGIIRWRINLQRKAIEIKKSCLELQIDEEKTQKKEAHSLSQLRLHYTNKLNQKKIFSEGETILVKNLISNPDKLFDFLIHRDYLPVNKKGKIEKIPLLYNLIGCVILISTAIFFFTVSMRLLALVTDNVSSYITTSTFILKYSHPILFIAIVSIGIIALLFLGIAFFKLYIEVDDAREAWIKFDTQYKEQGIYPIGIPDILHSPVKLFNLVFIKVISLIKT